MVISFKQVKIAALAIFMISNMGGITYGADSDASQFQAGIVIGATQKQARSPYSYNARYTCGAARVKISLAGYRDIKDLDCVGNIYSFTAWIDAHRTEVGFNAITGQILYF